MKISMIPNKIVKLIHASKGDTSLRKWAFEPYDNNGAINVSNIKDQLVYKTENGGTEQLLPVNTSTPTTSYFDGTINYGTDTDVEFTYKQSSYTGQARIKSIKGNTLVWNQLVNVTTGGSSNGITYTVSNGIVTANGTATAQSTFNCPNLNAISGHKYLLKGCPSGGAEATYSVIMGIYSITQNARDTGSGVIFTASGSGITAPVIVIASGITVNNMQFKVNLFDLTAMFGSGNEPTIEQFKSLFPLSYYAYNSGSLLNFNGTGIKTTGFNLCDNVWEKKSVNSSGNKITNNSTICNKEAIYVGKHGSYYFHVEDIKFTSNGRYMHKYDANMNYLGYAPISPNSVVTIPDDTFYIYIQINRAGEITEDYTATKVNFNISDSSKNGTYEPYTSSTLSLPISTYFPTGMKDVPDNTNGGKIYDELSDKAITRVGTIDLGSIEWAYTSNRAYSTVLNGIAKPSTSIAKAPNMIADKMEVVSANSNLSNGQITFVNISGEYYVFAYYDGVNSPSGNLNYELATYTETDIQNASLVCKNIEVPCYLSNGNLVCDATEDLTNESGFFDAKLKIKDSSSVAYSSKFKLHVEDL